MIVRVFGRLPLRSARIIANVLIFAGLVLVATFLISKAEAIVYNWPLLSKLAR